MFFYTFLMIGEIWDTMGYTGTIFPHSVVRRAFLLEIFLAIWIVEWNTLHTMHMWCCQLVCSLESLALHMRLSRSISMPASCCSSVLWRHPCISSFVREHPRQYPCSSYVQTLMHGVYFAFGMNCVLPVHICILLNTRYLTRKRIWSIMVVWWNLNKCWMKTRVVKTSILNT